MKTFIINLKRRIDRKNKMINRLNNLKQFDYQFIEAIDCNYGAIGCGKSHIKCLKLALNQNLPYILIMEDDIVIKDKLADKYFNYLEKIKEFDVVIFSGNDKKERINDLISKAIHISTTGMYLVKNHYYQTLIDNFQEAVNKMEQNITKNKDIDRNNNAIDVNWKKLQKKDNWIIFNENLGYQEPGFSDIENRNVDYLWCLN